MRARLAEAAARTAVDPVAHGNFLSYLRLLRFGALQPGGPFCMDHCRTLLADREFTALLWSAAVARPLNLRTVGALRENREEMIQKLGIPRDAFSRPKWLEEREAELVRLGNGAPVEETGVA
jgi:hypothetical protein